MSLAVVTIVGGRHEHLARHRAWVARLDPAPLVHVVVAMGDPEVAPIVRRVPGSVEVVDLPVGERLPLSRARNVGVDAAAASGASAVALLDVDCLPAPSFVRDHAEALARVAVEPGPHVVCGRVRYLPAGLSDEDHTFATLDLLAEDHPVRVVPEPGELVAGDPRLLWSLNISTTLRDWDAVGGFDEAYTGYGGEDTDFGQRLASAGGRMWWTRAAGAFHQHHPVSDPPVEHASDIARNATLFRARWGFDPMDGWLTELEARGLIRKTSVGWEPVTPATHPDDAPRVEE